MSKPKSGRITDDEMKRPSEYGGDPKHSGARQPHEVLRDMYRSDPTDPGDGRSR